MYKGELILMVQSQNEIVANVIYIKCQSYIG